MSESDVKPIRAGHLKIGNYLVHNKDVFVVKSSATSKAGKHGHAKVRMIIQNLFTGNKKSLLAPADDKFMQPIIEKKVAQVLSITSDSVQLMDTEDYNTYETALPDKTIVLEEGGYVDIWYVLGKKVIRGTRSDSGAFDELG